MTWVGSDQPTTRDLAPVAGCNYCVTFNAKCTHVVTLNVNYWTERVIVLCRLQTDAGGKRQAFPTRQVVYTLERYVRAKWACCGNRHTRAPRAKHTDDVRVYRASSDKIAPGAIPAAWRLITAWKSPQCVHVYKNVLEFGYRLALAWRPRLSVTAIILLLGFMWLSVCIHYRGPWNLSTT